MKHRISMTDQKSIAVSICMLVFLMTVPCLYGLNAGEVRENDYIVCTQPNDFSLDDLESFAGYTLFTPLSSTITYLINSRGDITHTWDSDYEPTMSVYLLDTGVILRATSFADSLRGFQKIAWDGTVISEVEYPRQHHDIEPLPNGNVLMITAEIKTNEEAIAEGRNPDLLYGTDLKMLVIVEIEPTGTSGGDVVWEWHVWDHLIQDFDPTKENYGIVADHPELVDFNFFEERSINWLHTNSIDYNEAFDQILISTRNLGEIWVIDHSTTTAEAAGHTGGKSGKGGGLLYRWGNPQSYRAGDEDDQVFSGQHDAQWIEPWCPGAGNILVLNNGIERDYGSVDEIVPPVDGTGAYSYVPGSAYGPEAPIWTCTALGFHPMRFSGAQRLPTGNTLICDGPAGRFFEVSPEQNVVWDYINPYPNPSGSAVFKARRYFIPHYHASIESIPGFDPTDVYPDGYWDYSARLYPNSPNPFAHTTAIRYDLAEPGPVSIVVYDVAGRLVRVLADMPQQGAGRHTTRWDGRDQFGKPAVSGVYFCSLKSRDVTTTRKMVRAR